MSKLSNPSVSRRGFIKISSLAGVGLVVGVQFATARTAQPPAEITFEPNIYIKISNTGKIIILNKNPEIGQGISTALPMLIAEELEADWQQIEVQQAPLNAQYGDQSTAGSSALRNNYELLRKAGAAVREALIEVAAKRWAVPLDACFAKASVVYRKGTDQKFSYAELVDDTISRTITPEFPTLKNATDFTLIGKPVKGVETPNIVTGKTRFGLDTRPKDTLIAVVERCPVFKGKVKRFDASAAQAVPGVVQVVELSAEKYNLAGVAIIAKNTWAALKGKKALTVEWDFQGAETESDETIHRKMEAEFQKPANKPRRNEGDVEKAFAACTKQLEATYDVPFWAHATMEPMNYVADVQPDRVTLVGPTQVPKAVQDRAVEITGLPADKISVTMTRAGGGFGRRLETDYATEALLLSKQLGKPVQVVWTREDDLQHDVYNARGRCWLKGGLDANNNLVAWQAKAANFFWPDSFPAGLVPNCRIDTVWVNTNIPLGAWRGPGHNVTAFYLQSFLDELATLAGKNPVDFQRELLGAGDRRFAQNTYGNKVFSTARMRKVIELVAEKSGWYQPAPKGQFRGFASHYTFGTYVAQVITLSMPSPTTVRIEKVVAAVDCGRVINPNGATAQLEGGIIDGLSVALNGAIHIEGGRVKESNFHDYPLLRFNAAPAAIDVHFVPSEEHPMGLGEMGLPPVIPALCNALFAATGKRIRSLPIRLGA
ncbi:molybdopterin cofactor-binding domain-containing protein [Larkinella sp. VNQ87]|uniref:xanthine dehydrogenase family protein molybdopterin-binding subunit n=1 Tax=Larkinella sp. VNQ87 TaxID=3400921 RepID=UPI003C07E1CB